MHRWADRRTIDGQPKTFNSQSVRYSWRDKFYATSLASHHFSNEALYEPRHEKTGFLHMRKQRRRSASLFSLYG